jgi:hypothetical protein
VRHIELWRTDVSKEQVEDERAGYCVTDRASHMRKAGGQCAYDKRGCSYQWHTQEFWGWGGSTNSVQERGQREWGCGCGSPLVRGSAQFANE